MAILVCPGDQHNCVILSSIKYIETVVCARCLRTINCPDAQTRKHHFELCAAWTNCCWCCSTVRINCMKLLLLLVSLLLLLLQQRIFYEKFYARTDLATPRSLTFAVDAHAPTLGRPMDRRLRSKTATNWMQRFWPSHGNCVGWPTVQGLPKREWNERRQVIWVIFFYRVRLCECLRLCKFCMDVKAALILCKWTCISSNKTEWKN